MNKKKKKITKKRKKFFIIAGCYIAVFLITCFSTAATLAWFNGSTFATDTVYLGGPVYMYFGNSDDVETSKAGALVLDTPTGWSELYPGMNVQIRARAVLQGAKFENVAPDTGAETTIYSTGAVLRARMMLKVLPPEGSLLPEEEIAEITSDIYNNIWTQVKAKAVTNVDSRNEGVWVLDEDYNYSETGLEEDHFFYYVLPGQDYSDTGNYSLLEVGGGEENVSVGFLDQAVITLSPIELDNGHADCRIEFTIIFHALQAFFPYLPEEVDQTYTGSDPNHAPFVLPSDVGTPKDLTIKNSRFYFEDSFDDIYTDEGAVI